MCSFSCWRLSAAHQQPPRWTRPTLPQCATGGLPHTLVRMTRGREFVVSIAEVVVCWALFGAVLRNGLWGRLSSPPALRSYQLRSHSVPITSPPVRRSTPRRWCCCCRESVRNQNPVLSRRRSVQHHCSAQRVRPLRCNPVAGEASICQSAVFADREPRSRPSCSGSSLTSC